jgi:hypothetical protein
VRDEARRSAQHFADVKEVRVLQVHLASTTCIALVRKRFCERSNKRQKAAREQGESQDYATKKFSGITPKSCAAAPSRGLSRAESCTADSL